MQATRVQRGDHIDYTPSSAVSAGDVVVLDNTPLVAELDIAADDLGALATAGVFDVVKKNEEISNGDWLYWDADGDPYNGTAGSGALTATSGDGVCMGYAVEDAVATAEKVKIRLLPLPTDNVTITETGDFSSAIADPGDAGAIPVTSSCTVQIVSAGAETRTLADPTSVGQVISVNFKTDGGDVTLTTASPLNQAGNNTAVFADAGDVLVLVAVADGADIEWRVLANDGAALSTV